MSIYDPTEDELLLAQRELDLSPKNPPTAENLIRERALRRRAEREGAKAVADRLPGHWIGHHIKTPDSRGGPSYWTFAFDTHPADFIEADSLLVWPPIAEVMITRVQIGFDAIPWGPVSAAACRIQPIAFRIGCIGRPYLAQGLEVGLEVGGTEIDSLAVLVRGRPLWKMDIDP